MGIYIRYNCRVSGHSMILFRVRMKFARFMGRRDGPKDLSRGECVFL